MTLINAANLDTAVPGWGLDTLVARGGARADARRPGGSRHVRRHVARRHVARGLARAGASRTGGARHVRRRAARHAVRACSDGNGTLSHLFFSDDDFDIARAKAICSKCGLRASCLAGALERGEVAGVWGGELVEDGAVVVLKRRRGRPPKVARPVLVVDEVPVPPHMVA